MNEEQFINLLASMSNGGEICSEAHSALVSFRELYPLMFLEINLSIIISDYDEKLKQHASTFIYGYFHHIPHTHTNVDYTQFVNQLISSLTVIFPRYPIDSIITNMILYTISKLLIIRLQNFGDTLFQSNLLDLYTKVQTLEPYILSIMADAVRTDENLGGFPYETLFQIVVGELHFNESIIPRFHLFFAVASHASESEELHQIFEVLLNSVPIDHVSDAISIIDSFSERSADFFIQHLEFLVPYLTQLCLDNNDDIRRYAMNCIATLVEGISIVFSKTSAYHQPIINCLIQSIMEVPDTEPDPDEDLMNDFQIFMYARDSLNRIFASAGCKEFAIYYSNLREETLNTSGISWKVYYGFVAAIAEFNFKTLFFLYPNDDENIFYTNFSFVWRFLEDTSVHPRLRIASYQALDKICLRVPLIPKEYANYLITSLINLMFNDCSLYGRKYAAIIISSYYKSRICNNIIECFPESFIQLLEIIPKAPEENLIYLIKSLNPFFNHCDVLKFIDLNDLINILIKIYDDTSDYNLKMTIIELFGLMGKRNTDSDIQIQLENICQKFLCDVIQLYISDTLSSYEIYPTFSSLVLILKENVLPLVSNYIQYVIESAKENIQTQEVNALHANEYPNSHYLKIPSNTYNTKIITPKTSADKIRYSLKILEITAEQLKLEFKPYLDDTLNIINKWVSNKNIFPSIVKSAYNLLHVLISIFHGTNIEPELIKFGIHYISTRTICTHDLSFFIKKILIVLVNLLYMAKSIDFYNEELWNFMYSIFPPLLEDIVRKKEHHQQLVTQLNQHDEENDIELENFNKLLETVVCIGISALFESYPQLTSAWFEKNLYEQCNQYINSTTSCIAGIIPLEKYCIATNNQDLALCLIDICTNIINSCLNQEILTDFDIDVVNYTMLSLGNILFNFVLPEETLEKFAKYLSDIMLHINDECVSQNNEEGMLEISEFAIVSMAKLVLTNGDKIDTNSALNDILVSLPFSNNVTDFEYVYKLLFSLLESEYSYFKITNNFKRVFRIFVVTFLNSFTFFISDQLINSIALMIQKLAQDTEYQTAIQEVIDAEDEEFQKAYIDLLNIQIEMS